MRDQFTVGRPVGIVFVRFAHVGYLENLALSGSNDRYQSTAGELLRRFAQAHPLVHHVVPAKTERYRFIGRDLSRWWVKAAGAAIAQPFSSRTGRYSLPSVQSSRLTPTTTTATEIIVSRSSGSTAHPPALQSQLQHRPRSNRETLRRKPSLGHLEVVEVAEPVVGAETF